MRTILFLACCILASGGAYAAAGLSSFRSVSMGAIAISAAAAWTAISLAMRRRKHHAIGGSIRVKAGPELVTQAELARAARKPIADLADLEWDRETVVAFEAPAEVAPFQDSLALAGQSFDDPLRHKILDRYITARFAGIATGAGDLGDSARVVKAARLLFEDGQGERGLELLQVASDLHPSDDAMRLARFELLFLERDVQGYRRAVERFHHDRPGSPQWPEIRELGRKLGLEGELFRDQGVRDNAFPQYGPWPGLPNWIQAPWDLSGEVAMAELHARMMAAHPIVSMASLENTRRVA